MCTFRDIDLVTFQCVLYNQNYSRIIDNSMLQLQQSLTSAAPKEKSKYEMSSLHRQIAIFVCSCNGVENQTLTTHEHQT